MRHSGTQDGGYASFMIRIGVGMKKAHRNTADVMRLQLYDHRGNRILIKWLQHLAAKIDPFGYLEPQRRFDKWRAPVSLNVILVKAVLEPHFQRIRVAGGGDQRCLAPFRSIRALVASVVP